MDRADVAKKLTKVVTEQLRVNEDKVVESAKFTYDLGADSLDKVELVMALEESFGIEIPEDSAETIITVGDAIDFILSKQSNA